jgi:uncharacterized protein YneF (UPF0154 family)
MTPSVFCLTDHWGHCIPLWAIPVGLVLGAIVGLYLARRRIR